MPEIASPNSNTNRDSTGAIDGEAVAALVTRAERLVAAGRVARSQRHPGLRRKDLGHLQRVGQHTSETNSPPTRASTKGDIYRGSLQTRADRPRLILATASQLLGQLALTYSRNPSYALFNGNNHIAKAAAVM